MPGITDDMLDRAPPPDGPPITDDPQAVLPKESVPLTDIGNGKRFVADPARFAFLSSVGEVADMGRKAWRMTILAA